MGNLKDKQLFIQFLKDNDAYEEYVYNFNKREKFRNKACPKNQFFSKKEPKEYILFAFTWDSTSEGLRFWNEIDIKWMHYLDSINNNYGNS